MIEDVGDLLLVAKCIDNQQTSKASVGGCLSFDIFLTVLSSGYVWGDPRFREGIGNYISISIIILSSRSVYNQEFISSTKVCTFGYSLGDSRTREGVGYVCVQPYCL